jgi:hypothetical protein
MYKKISPATFLLTFLSLVMFSFCKQKSFNKDKQAAISNLVQKQNMKDPSDTGISSCDSSLWQYVYNPTRLEVINKCMTVTGVIEESNTDDDGDQHMLLKLDAGQEKLLMPKNMKKKNGWLVIEAVCTNNIVKSKVGDACKGYVNHVKLPEVGNHVNVTGSYVVDTHNGWAEIHPITKIEVIK